ncbi:MAG: hypothetical protein QNJ01_11920 [Desulfobacterales bacterium]|nr:hypothetical protein [Desulfobacterales bacterium]
MAMPEIIDPGLVLDWNQQDFKTHFTPEKLLHLHPHWHVGEIGAEGESWRVALKNHETEKDFELVFRLHFPDDADVCMRVEFENAHLNGLGFERANGRIVIRLVNHRAPADPDDFQLELWLRGIFGYLGLYTRKTPGRLINRFVMNRFLIPMNPSQRKICIMIYRFTVLEVVVILLIVLGYFFFMR